MSTADLHRYDTNAGSFRHLLRIETQSTTQDSVGQPLLVWTLFANVMASIEPLNGREYFTAGADAAGITDRIVGRYLFGVLPNMRAMHHDDIYNIKSVIDVKMRRRFMVLMCERGVKING